MKLDSFHQPMRDMFLANLVAREERRPAPYTDKQIDDILNQCAGLEYCEQCEDIFCPWGEPLHFHHDGCPCCAIESECTPEENTRRKAQLLKRNQGVSHARRPT